MAEPSLALHKALLARLASLSVPVYDAVPQNTSYPYVTVDTSTAANNEFLTDRLDEHFIFLNVWSEQLGQAQVLSIMGEIDGLLHNAKLTLDTGTAVSVSVDRKSTTRDADNVTYMGTVTLRVMTQH